MMRMKTTTSTPVFPSSWFRIAQSQALPPGGVKPLHYFDRDFVLFRTHEGSIHLLDAFCPHLGAHLGHGGTIHRESIRCPYHGWKFNGSGHCVEVPYSKRLPGRKVHSWPVREISGLILMYYHPHGEEPTWEIPMPREIDIKEWPPLRLVHQWRVRTNLSNYLDNSIDVAHLTTVHHQAFRSAQTDSVERKGPTLTHRMTQYYNQSSMLAGRLIASQGSVATTYYGPGYDVSYYDVQVLSKMGCLLQIFTGTPIDKEYLDIEIYASFKKIFPNPLNWLLDYLLRMDTIYIFEQDIPILENKAYISNPPFLPEDSSIAQARQWIKQFYLESETSQGEKAEYSDYSATKRVDLGET